MNDLDTIASIARHAGASDIHLAAGEPPWIRVGGVLAPLDDQGLATEAQMEAIAKDLAQGRYEVFLSKGDMDCAVELGGTRYRVSLLGQTTGIGIVLRLIPDEVPDFADLHLPANIIDFADLSRGLVLVSGPTGQGKSTTLASLVKHILSTRSCHIVTIEDPIEYVHKPKKALIRQREVGDHTESFATALRHVLRQDPDVILVGEMRDPETMATAVTAAETGHLVFSTLHVRDAPGVINRIIDTFPAAQQAQVRSQLADALVGVVCQTLLPSSIQPGLRFPVCEILFGTPAVKSLVREGKIHQINSAIQSGVQEHGMLPHDNDLARLVAVGNVSSADALPHIRDYDTYRRYLEVHRENLLVERTAASIKLLG